MHLRVRRGVTAIAHHLRAVARPLGLCLLGLAACVDATGGPPTGATCPPDGTTLTYDSFGAPFMATYCTRCHATTLRGADRQGAPLYHDFDYYGGVMAVARHIDEWTGAGPDATNTQMPPDEPAPSLEERQQLAEWLACELANR